MPLSLQSLDFALICDGNELEAYGVKQEGPNSISAFVASETGKQFSITYTNKLLDTDIRAVVYIDGERTNSRHARAGHHGEIFGIRKSLTSVLSFKFQELELVDPDLENAPVVPDMGTIELRAFRCRVKGIDKHTIKNPGLHRGRVSERSKMAGWHKVSTGDEIPIQKSSSSVVLDILDPPNAPCASIKVFYRPRELLMAQGVITRSDVGAGINRGPEVNDRKRARMDGSPGPSKRRTASTVKKEEISANSRTQRIQALQAELNSKLNALMAGQAGSSVKRELRSPSPTVVGQVAGEVDTQRIQALQAELNSELNALMAEQSGSVKRELRSPSPIVVGQAAGEVVDLTLED